MYSTDKNDVKQLAQQIENLAREVVVRVDNGGDLLSVANELVRNNATFIFTLGEVYALEQTKTFSNKKSKIKVARSSGGNYHNLRDSRGRFAKV
jgi:hypothetical protein